MEDDIVIAQKILEGTYFNFNTKTYHDKSFMYMSTNEDCTFYQKYLKNHDKVLSVVSSGDQILNTILNDSYNIDAYDISRFPKYLLELKINAISKLDEDDYLDFFYKIDKSSEHYDDIYFGMNSSLPKEYKEFWDSLINFYDWNDITKSKLFSTQTVNIHSIINYNPYLQGNNYNLLKSKLEKANINFIIDDIGNYINNSKKKYDFVNLSSIIYYYDNYSELLKNIKLTNNGFALTYLYYMSSKIKDFYNYCTFDVDSNNNNAVMIYKK